MGCRGVPPPQLPPPPPSPPQPHTMSPNWKQTRPHTGTGTGTMEAGRRGSGEWLRCPAHSSGPRRLVPPPLAGQLLTAFTPLPKPGAGAGDALGFHPTADTSPAQPPRRQAEGGPRSYAGSRRGGAQGGSPCPLLGWSPPCSPLGGGGGVCSPRPTHLGIAPRGWQETGQRWDVPRCATGSTALCHGQGWAVARCAMGRAGMCHGQHRAVPRCAMSSPWGHRMGSAGAIPWAALGPCHRRCWAYATPCHRQHSSHTMRGIGAIP